MAALRMFIPITKIDVPQRLVYGLATAEVVDHAGEVCDYDSTKPLYEKWSAAISRSTRGKSLGNVRAMHGPVAAGKVTAINFNDEAKQIEICAKVVDDAEWAKVEEGVYTGFSQGGAYARRWTDAEGLTRYTAAPTEISLVDAPCLPQAQFEMIKADGAVEVRRFAKDPAGAATLDSLSREIEGVASEVEEKATGKIDPSTIRRLRDLILRASALLRAIGGEEGGAPGLDEDSSRRPSGSPKPEKALSPIGLHLAKNAERIDDGTLAGLQQMHDFSVELGAVCGVEKAMGSALEKRLGVLAECLSDMSQRLRRIEEQPLPLPLSGQLRPISKHEDRRGEFHHEDAIESLLADPHALSILAIKMAQRNGRAPSV